MNKSFAIIILASIVSFFSGYFLKGLVYQIEHSNDTLIQSTSSEKKHAYNVKSLITNDLNYAQNNQPKKDANSPSFTFKLDTFLTQYQYANYNTIPNRVLAPLYEYLSEFDTHQLQYQASKLVNQLPNAAATKLLGVTLEVLAEKEPTVALELALNLDNLNQFKWSYVWSILSVWSSNSPLEAYQWYSEIEFSQSKLGEPGIENMIKTAVLSGLYGKDKSLGIEKIVELNHQGRFKPSDLSAISNSFIDSEEFSNLLDVLSNSDNTFAVVEIVGEWLSKYPNDALAWVNNLNDKQKTEPLLRHVLNRWADIDPEQASNWYMNQFDEQTQQAAISEAAHRYAEEDPFAALEWVNSLERNDTQVAIVNVLRRASFDRPDFVIEQLDKVLDMQSQLELLQSAVFSIYQQDKKRAHTFIEASPFKAELEQFIEEMNNY